MFDVGVVSADSEGGCGFFQGEFLVVGEGVEVEAGEVEVAGEVAAGGGEGVGHLGDAE